MLRNRFVSGRPHALQTAIFVIALSCNAPTFCRAEINALSAPAALSGDSQALALPTAAALKKHQESLAERRHRVRKALETATANSTSRADIGHLRLELEVLKYYELICAQYAEEISRTGDIEQDLKQWQERLHELRLAGPEEPKPYSILLLDDVQDQLDAAKTRLHTVTLELDAAKDIQETTARLRHEAEAERRKAKEALPEATDERLRLEIAKRLELAELKSRMFTDIGRLRRTERLNTELEQQVSELETSYFQEKLTVIAADAVFTQEHLKAVLSEIDKFEVELAAQLPQLQSRLQELEAQAFDAAQKQKKQATDSQLQAEAEKGWRVARRTYQQQIKLIQQRRRELVIVRLEWDVRYKVVNGQATRKELASWADDNQLYLDRIRANRTSLEESSKALMVELGRKEKQLRIARQSNPEIAKWIEYQIGSMHELSQAYGANLVQVETIERMLAKLNATFSKDLKSENVSQFLSSIGTTLSTAWNYEITSVDDRPITVRKIVAGIVLMLLGFYASRRLSRLIGNRMLPRIGIDNGAATALQSISFYLLVTCFGFVSLEIVNVPITVFTFLGGAVAIGVGFGSQNILNNFISGLILLAEQPIRVGDLIDIGGLCGNVEKIGARSTRVITGANLDIIVPNSKFLEDNVTNWTLTDTRMRTTVKVGVAYGSPTDQVAAILKQAVDECPHAMNEPEPIILFNDFGDNSLNFEVHFWIYVRTMMQARKIESALRHAIDKLMREAKITIAYPQRDVHLDAVKPIEVNIRQIAAEQGFAVRRSNAA